MANFNEKINCGIGYNPNSKEFLIYRRGSIVPCFRIPAEVFDRIFGLNENFPKQYENVFGKTEEAKPVQKENDLIEKAQRNIESCKNSLYLAKQMIERAVEFIQGALIDIEGKKHELDELFEILE